MLGNFNLRAGLLGVVLAFAGCTTPAFLTADLSPSAIAADDPTALLKVEGCGYQPLVTEGYAYCRMVEGPVGTLAITFVAPPQAKDCAPHACDPTNIACDPTSCVDFTIFSPDGNPAYQDQIPYGQTAKVVPWKTLTGKDTLTTQDRGFWPYTYTIRWKDRSGLVHRTVSEGELRLRVIRAQVCPTAQTCSAYVPLRTTPRDSHYAWSWVESGQIIRMTTAARTFVQYPGAKQ